METEGRVIDVSGESVTVEVRRKGACGDHCAGCGGCSAQIVRTDAFSDIPVKPGDWVELKSNNRSVFAALTVVMMLPLILPAAAYLIAAPYHWGIPAVVSALIVSVFFIFLLNRNARFQKNLRPRVAAIISSKEIGEEKDVLQ